MTQHAVLGASKSAQWINCPGSIALSAGLPNKGSTYADWGTAAHTLAEWCLNPADGQHDEAARFIGRSIAVGEVFIRVDAEMADVVQCYVDYVRDVVNSTGGTLLIEQRVDYSACIGVPESFGTADTIILAGDEIIVVDLKTGRGEEVDAFENSQLRLYALGALEEFGLVGEFKQARLVIVQPRVSRKPSEHVDTLADLEAFRLKAWSSAQRAAMHLATGNPPDDALVPGEKQCRWCLAKSTCPKLQAEVSRTVFDDFEALVATDEPTPVTPSDAEAEARVFARLDMIEGWIEARRERARTLAASVELPGYKLVAGKRGARAWTDAEQAEATLKAMRLKVDEMYDFKLISPTKAEKVLKDNPRKWAKLEGLITQSEGKPAVVPVSDKRPALVVNADAFDCVGPVDDLV